jgi:hypothetical protein
MKQAICTLQNIAKAVSLTACLNLVLSPIAFATNEATVYGKARQFMLALDSAEAELDRLTVEAIAHPEVAVLSPREARKVTTWTNRLTNASPRVEKRIRNDIAQLSDAEVADTLSNLDGVAPEVTALPSEVAREVLVSSGMTNYQNNIPKMASSIAAAGGMIPYLAEAKTQLKEVKLKISRGEKIKEIADAALCILLDVIWVGTLLGAVLGIVLLFTGPVGWGIGLIGGGVLWWAIGIRKGLICMALGD